MSPHPTTPALTATAVTAVILLARWAASRPQTRQRTPSAARPPWRPTAPTPAPIDNPEAAVREAEEHVHRHWQQLRARSRHSD